MKPLGPVHPTTDPSVVTPSVTLPAVHDITPPVAVTEGVEASLDTVAVPVAVHPLADATVTVYVPAALTLGEASVDVNPLGPDQLTIVASVVALRVTEVTVQVSTPPTAVTLGA